MIHELIDPKKKTNRAGTKTTEPKTVSEEINFEVSDSENKESSSTIFIPPWLRNSLGLNQRNLDWSVCLPNFTALGHPTGSSDLKSSKVNHRSKEHSQNEFESLKTKNGGEEDCCKKAIDVLPEDDNCPEQGNIPLGSDNVEGVDNNNEESIPIYWDMRQKGSETEWSCGNAESRPVKKKDSKMTDTDTFTVVEIEKLKEEDKKRTKVTKQKNKVRKRIISKQTELDKTEMDFLLEMKAREALDEYMKGGISSVSSEMRQLEAKLLLLSAKARNRSSSKLNQQDIRILQEVKQQTGSVEQIERVFEHVKDVNLREVIRNPDFLCKNIIEKTREDKEEKCIRQVMQKCGGEVKTKTDKDSLISTDDENDIKRFSEFLSKNKNLDEKRKCLEEVRNYFERKRRTRLTKRRFVEDGKPKPNFQKEGNEERLKDKVKSREGTGHRGKRSKFSLCEEEVVEKAVDEALQKFVELYHFRVSPSVMGSMKKNILEAIATDSVDSSKNESSPGLTKINLDLTPQKETEKKEDTEVVEVFNKESPQRDIKITTELIPRITENVDIMENEKIIKLKKEFEIFLNSVQSHIDVTNLKLQSIILEKEEQTPSTQNVQFVYNFKKKALEPEKPDYWPSLKEVLEFRNRKDSETQTATDLEPGKRNAKVQAVHQQTVLEQGFQTDDKTYIPNATQTDGEGMTMREIKELKSNDVNPGLYRMVRSQEAGKFYLYPEQLDDDKGEMYENSNSSVVKDKNFYKNRHLMNILSKERTKERQIFIREKAKLKKNRRTPMYAVTHLNNRKKKREEMSENSISCLYFRNLDKKASDSISSKKEVDLTDENMTGRLDAGEDLGLLSSHPRENHVGCFWFWNGEKIAPGCDLKAHVENLLKEKLTQMTGMGENQQEFPEKTDLMTNIKSEKVIPSEKKVEASTIFSFSDGKNEVKENNFAETETSDERKRSPGMEEKKEQTDETEETLMSVSHEKPVKNASTQESQLKFLSLNLSKPKSQGTTVRRKCTKRNIVIKPAHGKVVNIRKAQELLRAVEEIKKLKLGLGSTKKMASTDSESLLDCTTSTSSYKHPGEDTLSMVLGLKESQRDTGEMSNTEIKNRLKKLINLVDREVQTNDSYDAEDGNSVGSVTPGSSLNHQKHLELIGRVLSKVSHRQRENLWNDVRHIIKTKIGKDVNGEGTKEVCIEIEQDLPKADQGKHAVLAKGHYCKNEGDVEVEIDLTLEDLARILCQRQKKIRRRNMYRSSKSKNFMSSSSGQSDITREDIRRYQKYLHGFTTLRQGRSPDRDTKQFKVKTKGN